MKHHTIHPTIDTGAPDMNQDTPSTPVGGKTIGERYEIQGLLGSGGMGNVYKVRDTILDEVVALKTLHPSLSADERALARFRREVKLARRITHPNIARTFDIGLDGQIPFLTMEFIDGEPLSTYMKRRDVRCPHELVKMSLEIARGLGAAHGAGVIHRDLKPANVMVARDGRLVITDFGVARVARNQANSLANTGANAMVGTPMYMAPEQVEGRVDVDHRADVFALGVMMYEMLQGEAPFEGESLISLALARLLKDIPRISKPGLSGELVELVATAMSRHPEHRHDDTEELIRDLERVLASTTPSPDLNDTIDTSSGVRLREQARQLSPTSTQTSVALLPLVNRASDDDAYLAEGFIEEVVGELSMADGLRVKPASATSGLAGHKSTLEAGRALGVDVIVEGSLRRIGPTLRIRLALVSVREEFQIWGEKFTGEAGDIFTLAEQAARALANALTTQVEEQKRPVTEDDPRAIELLMRARYILNNNWFDQVNDAVDLLEQALVIAPDSPRVLTGLATAYARMVFFEPERAFGLLAVARTHATRANELAPDWAAPHFALAIIGYNSGDLTTAIAECEAALEHAPDFLEAHDLLGRILTEVGPLDRARAHLERAVELDKHLYRARIDLMRVHALRGDWDEFDVIAELTPLEESELPAFYSQKMRLSLWRDDPIDVPEYLIIQSSTRPAFQGLVGLLERWGAGEELSSDQIAAVIEQATTLPFGSQVQLLLMQLCCEISVKWGYLELGIAALSRAVRAGLRDLMWLEHSPVLDALRSHSDFPELARRTADRTSAARATLTLPSF